MIFFIKCFNPCHCASLLRKCFAYHALYLPVGLCVRYVTGSLVHSNTRLLICSSLFSFSSLSASLFACSCARLLVRSPARALACSCARLLVRSPARALACSCARLLVRSPARALACSCARLLFLNCSLARPYACALVRSIFRNLFVRSAHRTCAHLWLLALCLVF